MILYPLRVSVKPDKEMNKTEEPSVQHCPAIKLQLRIRNCKETLKAIKNQNGFEDTHNGPKSIEIGGKFKIQ